MIAFSKLTTTMLGAFLLFANISFATTEYMTLEPLLGSEWAKAHPGQLPYSKCNLVQMHYNFDRVPLTERRTWKTPHVNVDRTALIVGGIIDDKRYYFSCVSQKHGLAFMLPIKLSSMANFPEVQVVASDVHNKFHFDKGPLDGAPVKALLHRFFGAGISASFALGAGGFAYGNLSGLGCQVGQCQVSIAASAMAGLATVKLKLVRDKFKLPSTVHNSAYLITGETASSNVHDPIVVCDGVRCGIQIQEMNLFKDVLRTIQVTNGEGKTENVETLIKTRVHIPTGTLAMWNGAGFEVEYSLTDDLGHRQATEMLKTVTAVDGSIVNDAIHGRIFTGYRDGSVILHRTTGSYVRNASNIVDVEAIKNLHFVWDNRAN